MKAIDTSVCVAAFASWHEYHTRAQKVLDARATLIGYCALESYCLLTRLQPPHRAPPALVRDFLRLRFPEPFLEMERQAYQRFVLELPEHGVTGGGAYDALIAATAAAHCAQLVTCDRRAAAHYERYQVQVLLL